MIALAAVVAAVGCGRKGPPLAPIVRVPAAVTVLEVQRVGSDVYLAVSVPSANIDSTKPASISRIEVYGVTAETSPGARFLERATLVATIPVVPPPVESALVPPPRSAGAQQGEKVIVHDALEPADLVPVTLPPPPTTRRPAAPIVPARPGVLRRFYTAIAFGRSGPSAQGAIVELPLGALPGPPENLDVRYSAEEAVLEWEPAGGTIGFLLDRPLPIEPPPVDLDPVVDARLSSLDVPPGPTRFNVYRTMEADPLELPGPPAPSWEAQRPMPLNAAPLMLPAFNDPLTLDGRRRCYQIRAVRGEGTAAVESDPTPPFCFNAVDVFPPAAPTGLSATAGEDGISLIWDSNIDIDLGGYLVLRGTPGDATLTRLTGRPIAAARYTDSDVVAGRRYVYTVVAVDDRLPVANVSELSERVEETAR